MLRQVTKALLPLLLVLSWATSSFAQVTGDLVRLSADNAQGVPVHPAAGNPTYVRWPNGTTGTIANVDGATGWFQISTNGSVGWVTRRYITLAPSDSDEEDSPANELQTAVIGTWNLEWLKDGKGRGFPENTYQPAGPSYNARIKADYERIANVITANLGVSILILEEIGGKTNKKSDELDRLVQALGEHWAYELTASGGDQHVAILYNDTKARKNKCVEFDVVHQEVQNSDVFARDPLVCYFTLLDSAGTPKNDLLVVGLHLASGQEKTQNHNEAMKVLQERLKKALTDGTFPMNEKDILIGGDFNASRYDKKLENFWVPDAAKLNLKTLSPDDGEEYLGTRLAGVPLVPSSKIDYLMYADLPTGLANDLVQTTAQVRQDLLPPQFDDWRAHLSDHIPVTIRIKLQNDDD